MREGENGMYLRGIQAPFGEDNNGDHYGSIDNYCYLYEFGLTGKGEEKWRRDD